jgi:hypothetical protein
MTNRTRAGIVTLAGAELGPTGWGDAHNDLAQPSWRVSQSSGPLSSSVFDTAYPAAGWCRRGGARRTARTNTDDSSYDRTVCVRGNL